MRWADLAIVLGGRRWGESHVILSVLTRSHGRYDGLLHGGGRSARRSLVQEGNIIAATWFARLADQLGTLTAELKTAVDPRILHDPARLAALSAACSLVRTATPERDRHGADFESIRLFIQQLGTGEDWLPAYAAWERAFIAALGHAVASGGPADAQAPAAMLAGHLVCLQSQVFADRGATLPAARLRLNRHVAAAARTGRG
jgi:DNA repair protein RecO (recombination protein O)